MENKTLAIFDTDGKIWGFYQGVEELPKDIVCEFIDMVPGFINPRVEDGHIVFDVLPTPEEKIAELEETISMLESKIAELEK